MSSLLTEDQIQDAIAKPDADWAVVGNSIKELYKAGSAGKADALIELAEDTLKNAGKFESLLELYELRSLHGSELKNGQTWSQVAARIIGSEWEQKALIEQSGFDTGLAPDECFRRLKMLKSLKDGVVCFDRSWGTGVVGKIDYFYKRVDIDFKKKRGHQLALSYAAEKLLLLDQNHILFHLHANPADLAEKIKSTPGEVLKIALQSFGAMPAAQLQEKLVPDVMPEKDWKNFWEGARRQLKNDKTVQIPSNRKDPLRLIDATETGKIGETLNGLGTERNLDTLVQRFEELAAEVGAGGVTEQQKKILQDRLAFVVKGAGTRQSTVLARVKMAALSLGVDDESNPQLAAINQFFDSEIFLETLKKLPVKQSGQFLRYLSAQNKSSLDQLLTRYLLTMDVGSMAEVISYLFEQGNEKAVSEIFRGAVDTRNPGIEVLSWLSRNMDKVAAWNLGSMNQILHFMVDEIENNYAGDQLKAQNQLKERWSKSDWMKSALAQLDGPQRETLVLRVKASTGWAVLDKQSQLAVMVKLHPELEALIAKASKQETVKPKGPLTSIRSYEERKEQLQRIVNFEIPKVAKEIALAREYGDLRENFEYKAAKDAQALLFRRRDEIGAMLAKVTPTDFKDLPCDKAGPATSVEIKYGDGRTEEFYLLGEWDTEPSMHIISSNSRMAQVLNGHVAGDSLMIPTEEGDATCVITAIKPLPEKIRLWIERK